MQNDSEYSLIYHPKEFPAFPRMHNETFAKMTEDEYLLYYRGPQFLPLAIVIPITILYSIIFITGVIGNSLVCFVIWRNVNMHTATNFYLFSLAASDLTLLLLGLPNDLQTYWKQYPWVYGFLWCKTRAVLSETCCYSSVLVIVAFSVERYMAVCKPFHTYQISTLTRARWVIAIVWIVSFIAASPIAYYTTVDYLHFPPDSGPRIERSAFCVMLADDYRKRVVPIYELSSIFFFTIPMMMIGGMYWKITVTLTERDRNGIRRQYGPPDVITRKSIIRMLGAVVLAFFCCWAPFHLQRLIFLHMINDPNYQIVNEWLYYVTGCFYYFSATVNPILYSLMSARFREAFRATLLCHREDLGMGPAPPRERCPQAGVMLQRFGGDGPDPRDAFELLTPVPTSLETPLDPQESEASSRIPHYDSQTTVGIDENVGSTVIDIESPIITIHEYEEEVCRNTSVTIVEIENDFTGFTSNDSSPSSNRTICELIPRSFSVPFPETKIPIKETYI